MTKDIEKVIRFQTALKKADHGDVSFIKSFNEWGRHDGDTVYDMTEANGWVYFIGWHGVYKARPDGTELSQITEGNCSMINSHENGAVTFTKSIESYSEVDEQAQQFDRYTVDVRCTVTQDGKITESEPSKAYLGSSD